MITGNISNVRVQITMYLVSLVFCLQGYSQNDAIWYDKNWKLIDKDKASFFRPPVMKRDSLFLIRDYYANGTLQMEGLSTKKDQTIWEGKVTWYKENGEVLQVFSYQNGRLEGDMITFYKDQKLIAKYKNGRLISGENNFIFTDTQRYTEIKDSIIREISYDQDLNGVRYESIRKITNDYSKEIEVKYYGNNGEYLGTSSIDNDTGKYDGVFVRYYKNPLRVKQIRDYTYKNGRIIAFYYPNGVIRERTDVDNKKNIEYYDKKGKLLYAVKYGNLNKAWDFKNGTRVKFYSDVKEDKMHLIEYIEEFDQDGQIVYTEYFYENQKTKSKTFYENNTKKEIINYDEAGKETSRLQYKDYKPFEGILIEKNRKLVYKEGILIKETQFYPESSKIFSVFENGKATYYNDKGNQIGEIVSSSNEFLRPKEGTQATIDYKGRLISTIKYENGVATYEKTYRHFDKDSSKLGIEERFYEGYNVIKHIYYYHDVPNKRSVLSYANGNKKKEVFFDRKGKEIGNYDHELRNGILITYFYNTDVIKEYKEKTTGNVIRSKKYQDKYNREVPGNYSYVLIEDIDINNKATFYTENGDIIAELLFKEQKPYEGTAYDHTSRTYYTFKDGKKNGIYKKLDYNQTIIEKGNYKNDVREGLFVSFDYNGNKLQENTYVNDKLDGTSIFYDKNGKVISKLTYSAGIPFEGKEIKRDEEIWYKDGKISKSVKTTNKNITETTYITESNSNVIVYDKQKKSKVYEYSLVNYKLDGKVIRYNDDQKPMYTSFFEKGVMKAGEIVIKENTYNLRDYKKIWIKIANETLQMKCFDKEGVVSFQLKEKANEYGEFKNTYKVGLNLNYIVPNIFF